MKEGEMSLISPEKRCYTILENSNFVRIPEEEFAEILKYFLDAIKDCSWEYPSDKIQERQFETNVKTCFSQFHDELFQFAKDNQATINGLIQPFKNIGLHTMDEQGFEGQIMSDGRYVRTIDYEPEYIFFKVSDEELESKWQASSQLIKTCLEKSYAENTPEKESEEWYQKAKEAQDEQGTIQAEITRRHQIHV